MATDLLPCPKEFEVHPFTESQNFMVTAANASLELHIPHCPHPAGHAKVYDRSSPHHFPHHLEKEVVISTSQNPPGSLMFCCFVSHVLYLSLFCIPALNTLPMTPDECQLKQKVGCMIKTLDCDFFPLMAFSMDSYLNHFYLHDSVPS